MKDYNDCYYRIIQMYDEDKLTIVCMQWFDEHDYDESRFLTDDDGFRLRFDDKDEAIQWLNDNIKEEYIDKEYLKVKFSREKYYKNKREVLKERGIKYAIHRFYLWLCKRFNGRRLSKSRNKYTKIKNPN